MQNENETYDVLQALYDTVIERRDNPQEKSYTCYLLDTGLDKILKKVGEECAETIIAAKNDSDTSPRRTTATATLSARSATCCITSWC